MARRVGRADRRHAHAATRAFDGPLMTLAGEASELADQPPLIALSAATIVAGVALRRPVVLRAGVRMLASHLAATGVKTILKSMIDRTRPSRAVAEGYHVGKGDGADDSSLNSFPSGHTAGAVAVAQAVAAEAPLAALPLQAAAIGVGALQPRRGKHYLSDVLAGAAIGWASERLVDAVLRRVAAAIEAHDAPDPEEEAAAHPS
ncbi:phosphatase PAP2 family protein [Sphingomonas rubra]|uniref:phosphatase PAP2 family protein n=1 Tax=Sphingomonas rubra TaxID=634430 RepID=UPI000A4E143D|nr:phosphatase PAP2 family protein [Sphingomonas rubra]